MDRPPRSDRAISSRREPVRGKRDHGRPEGAAGREVRRLRAEHGRPGAVDGGQWRPVDVGQQGPPGRRRCRLSADRSRDAPARGGVVGKGSAQDLCQLRRPDRQARGCPELGRASCRERECQYVSITEVAVFLIKTRTTINIITILTITYTDKK